MSSILFAGLVTLCAGLAYMLYSTARRLVIAQHTADHYEMVHEQLQAQLEESTELLYRAAHRDEEHRRTVEGYEYLLAKAKAQPERRFCMGITPVGWSATWLN